MLISETAAEPEAVSAAPRPRDHGHGTSSSPSLLRSLILLLLI